MDDNSQLLFNSATPEKFQITTPGDKFAIAIKIGNSYHYSFYIDENGVCQFPRNDNINNIVTINTDQTINSYKVFAGAVAFNNHASFTNHAHFNSGIYANSWTHLNDHTRVKYQKFISFDRWDGNLDYWQWFSVGLNDYSNYGALALTVKEPVSSATPNAIWVWSNGKVQFPSTRSYHAFDDVNHYVQSISFEQSKQNRLKLSQDPHLAFKYEIFKGAHIDKIQIRVDKPFCQDGFIAIGNDKNPCYLAKIDCSNLTSEGVYEYPIAKTAPYNFKAQLMLEGTHHCGEGEVYIVSR